MQNLNKQISIKNNQERNANHQSVFENLYMKKFISSLGKKYLKPEIPKSVFPKSRMSSVQFNRPGTAIYKLNCLVHNCSNKQNSSFTKYSTEVKRRFLMRNEYWDEFSQQKKHKNSWMKSYNQFRSFDSHRTRK